MIDLEFGHCWRFLEVAVGRSGLCVGMVGIGMGWMDCFVASCHGVMIISYEQIRQHANIKHVPKQVSLTIIVFRT